MKIKKNFGILLVGVLLLAGCSRTKSSGVLGPIIDAGSIPEEGQIVSLNNGAQIYLQKRNGIAFFRVEGTFTPEYFSQLLSSAAYKPQNERKATLAAEVEKIFGQIKTIQGIGLTSVPEVGYFTLEVPYPNQADFMAPLKSLPCAKNVLMNPIVYESNILETIQALSPTNEGLNLRAALKKGTKGFSGLERLHAIDFVKQAEADIGGGVKVNGSSVNVGVTDTGVTLNHPTFLSEDGSHSRITYMRDFTREGRVYFNKNAKFEVSVPQDSNSEDLVLNAEVLVTPTMPFIPAGDQLTEVKGLTIKTSPELRSILTQPGSGAKLGVLNEGAFQSPSEPVDLNGNGKLDDLLFIILIPGKTAAEDVVYIDPSGTGDFRNSKPIGDWNKTKTTISVFSEKIGFDFKDDVLPSAKGDSKIPVRSVSIVGFDPGNHGSHVSGIIAGRKTIQNDDANTLARGVAPQANLLVNRVCANNGGCNAAAAFIDLVVNAGADVINMSLGGLNPFNDGYGVQETLINRLTSHYNVLFMISAGNSGPGRQTVGSPSTARLALSIGATANREMIQRQYQWPGAGTSEAETASDEHDFMLFFSSRGPTAAGGFKPNISAPGTELSSIQLNSAPGARGGLDVYWGTSMAAPAATGAYALLLDAIRKYNLKNPLHPLPTKTTLLREILIQTARPFDVSRYNPTTGEQSQGQYTWVDQGTGMIDLTAAWKKLLEIKDQNLPTAVNLDGKSIELEYQVVVPMKAPNGNSYDGSKPGSPGLPAFGTGIYLSAADTDTLRQVSILRRLPEGLAASSAAGELMSQLKTTHDEFVLKTVIYGSNKPWIKAGSLDQLGCNHTESQVISVIGEGATIDLAADGTGVLNPTAYGSLNLCIDRNMIKELQPGDHGALIYGYRTVDGHEAPLPSFTVPVYLTVPHQTLEGSTAYEIQGEVSSFGVKRNYVQIPKGTSLVKVTLEVPVIKAGELSGAGTTDCAGVELMALAGSNVSKPIKNRQEARTSNCDANGRPFSPETQKKVSFTQANPKPGIWDLAVFGSYKFTQSKYKLRVDYFTTTTNVQEIKGDVSALNGSMRLSILESTLDQLMPDVSKSGYAIFGLQTLMEAKVRHGEQGFIPNGQSALRTYSNDIKKVIFQIGGSPGNDLDLYILECAKEATLPSDPSCTLIGKSDGPSDEESVTFTPKAAKAYAVRVDGVSVKSTGTFVSKEILVYEPEKGNLSITGKQGIYEASYAIDPERLKSSKLANDENFRSGKSDIIGGLILKTADGTTLSAVPVSISAKK